MSKTTFLVYSCKISRDLEFAVPVWNPYLISDIAKLEGVQRRATKVAQFRTLWPRVVRSSRSRD